MRMTVYLTAVRRFIVTGKCRKCRLMQENDKNEKQKNKGLLLTFALT